MENSVNYKKLYEGANRKNKILGALLEPQQGTVKKQQGTIEKLQDTVKKQQGTIENLQEQVDDLQRRDNYHDGPNTPSSRNTMTRQQDRKIRRANRTPSKRKQGGQPGHRGTARRVKIDREKVHALKECTRCGSGDLQEVWTERRRITDIPPPPPAETVLHTIPHYTCSGCGREIRPDTGIPDRGEFGYGVIKRVMADHTDRMPIRRIAGRLAESDVKVSGGAIQGILDMVGSGLEAPRREVEKDIRQADTLNADETSSRLHNDSVRTRVFLDPETGSTAYRISPNRGRGVITDLLGEKPGGHVACDGWGPYRICRVQRCWAHLIREVRTISRKNPEDKECKMALARLRTIYGDAKKSSRDPTRGRKRHKRMLETRMRRLINRCRNHHILGPCMKKLERALPDSFWFVLDPRIPSTNNAAERALRESVIQNRIRGCLRSEKSMPRIGNIMTCFTTWKNRGLDLLAEMCKYI